MLKILSRITEPIDGRAVVRGRVASLLEVGTGFHPELTGRENIFLNGAILGMTRAEIRKKFDEIVAFAEVERFLDTPVKRYSSGMYVRLAFAVAAHLEPEILIVDEVLAVGDSEFQRKCLGKMQEVSTKDGRTVLFVSHNMAAVESMCGSALLLVGGQSAAHGSTAKVVGEYLRDLSRIASLRSRDRTDRSGSGELRFVSMITREILLDLLSPHFNAARMQFCTSSRKIVQAANCAASRNVTRNRQRGGSAHCARRHHACRRAYFWAVTRACKRTGRIAKAGVSPRPLSVDGIRHCQWCHCRLGQECSGF